MSRLRVDDAGVRVAADRMAATEQELGETATMITTMPSPTALEGSGSAADLAAAARVLEGAGTALSAARQRADDLRAGLECAAWQYEHAEALATCLMRLELGAAAAGVGIAAVALLPHLPAIAAGVALLGAAAQGSVVASVTAVWTARFGRPPTPEELDAVLRQVPSPVGTALIPIALRLGIEYVDEAVTGRPWTPFDPGEVTRGVVGLLGASAVPTTERFRVAPTPHPVTSATAPASPAGGAQGALAPARRPLTAPPAGFGEVIDRIPPSEDRGPQVRISEYLAADGSTFYEVLIAGTSHQGYLDTSNPFDHAGNGAAFSQLDAESVAAVEGAMAAAGIRPGDGLVLAGYSQGGIVAADLAASGRWNAQLLVTAGSPIGDVPVPESTPIVEFVHDEDPVPALEGLRDPWTDRSTVISTSVAGNPGVADDPMGAHGQGLYVATASAADASAAPELAGVQEDFAAVYGGARLIESTAYRIDREERE